MRFSRPLRERRKCRDPKVDALAVGGGTREAGIEVLMYLVGKIVARVDDPKHRFAIRRPVMTLCPITCRGPPIARDKDHILGASLPDLRNRIVDCFQLCLSPQSFWFVHEPENDRVPILVPGCNFPPQIA